MYRMSPAHFASLSPHERKLASINGLGATRGGVQTRHESGASMGIAPDANPFNTLIRSTLTAPTIGTSISGGRYQVAESGHQLDMGLDARPQRTRYPGSSRVIGHQGVVQQLAGLFGLGRPPAKVNSDGTDTGQSATELTDARNIRVGAANRVAAANIAVAKAEAAFARLGPKSSSTQVAAAAKSVKDAKDGQTRAHRQAAGAATSEEAQYTADTKATKDAAAAIKKANELAAKAASDLKLAQLQKDADAAAALQAQQAADAAAAKAAKDALDAQGSGGGASSGGSSDSSGSSGGGSSSYSDTSQDPIATDTTPLALDTATGAAKTISASAPAGNSPMMLLGGLAIVGLGLYLWKK